jgi:hypothetical protein
VLYPLQRFQVSRAWERGCHTGRAAEWDSAGVCPEVASTNNALLVHCADYAGAYSKGENSPYLPLWSYASLSSVTRYVFVAHNSCVLDVNPVGL